MKTAASNKKNLPAPRLLRSGAVTAGATFMSRILGMFRDIAIAGLLGAGLSADVYFFANRIPNFFRRLFAEGAFAQAFVPVMTKTKRDKSAAELKELAAKSAGTLGLIVLIISIIGMVLSPVVKPGIKEKMMPVNLLKLRSCCALPFRTYSLLPSRHCAARF